MGIELRGWIGLRLSPGDRGIWMSCRTLWQFRLQLLLLRNGNSINYENEFNKREFNTRVSKIRNIFVNTPDVCRYVLFIYILLLPRNWSITRERVHKILLKNCLHTHEILSRRLETYRNGGWIFEEENRRQALVVFCSSRYKTVYRRTWTNKDFKGIEKQPVRYIYRWREIKCKLPRHNGFSVKRRDVFPRS